MSHPTNSAAVKVKRDGERGWHWAAAFDPAIHELYDAPAVEVAPVDQKPSPAPARGRQKKGTN